MSINSIPTIVIAKTMAEGARRHEEDLKKYIEDLTIWNISEAEVRHVYEKQTIAPYCWLRSILWFLDVA